jgi:hypothetical protein
LKYAIATGSECSPVEYPQSNGHLMSVAILGDGGKTLLNHT